MRHPGLCRRQNIDFALVEMNAMTHHRLRSKHPAFLIDVGIIAGAHEEMMHLLDFFAVLREMSLEVGAEACGQFRCAAHHFLGTGYGESGTESVFETAFRRAVPFATKPLAFE